MKLSIEECISLLTCSPKMKHVWKEAITSDSLFSTIKKIKFSEKQEQQISELVGNVFFYEENANTRKISCLHLMISDKEKISGNVSLSLTKGSSSGPFYCILKSSILILYYSRMFLCLVTRCFLTITVHHPLHSCPVGMIKTNII